MKTDPKETKTGLAKAIIENPESFVCLEDKNEFNWTLKRDIIENRLVDFLKRYFTDFYGLHSESSPNWRQSMLDYLSTGPSADEIYAWFDNDHELNFNTDEIVPITYGGSKMNICISNLELTCEGKVQYEEMEQHLQFFESSLRKVYKDDPFGGCLMVTVD